MKRSAERWHRQTDEPDERRTADHFDRPQPEVAPLKVVPEYSIAAHRSHLGTSAIVELEQAGAMGPIHGHSGDGSVPNPALPLLPLLADPDADTRELYRRFLVSRRFATGEAARGLRHTLERLLERPS